MMAHLDFEVTDLRAETARAVNLGATLAAHQPQENVRDPSRSRRAPILSIHGEPAHAIRRPNDSEWCLSRGDEPGAASEWTRVRGAGT